MQAKYHNWRQQLFSAAYWVELDEQHLEPGLKAGQTEMLNGYSAPACKAGADAWAVCPEVSAK